MPEEVDGIVDCIVAIKKAGPKVRSALEDSRRLMLGINRLYQQRRSSRPSSLSISTKRTFRSLGRPSNLA